MAYGPFQTEEAGKIILTLAKDKLLPAVKDLEIFSIEVAAYRLNLYKVFFRKELHQLDDAFQKKNRTFLELYHHYSTPDLLFATIKTKNDTGLYIVDYFSSQQAMERSFQEGFKFIEIIDRQLIRRLQSADQTLATTISLTAIAISLITAITKF